MLSGLLLLPLAVATPAQTQTIAQAARQSVPHDTYRVTLALPRAEGEDAPPPLGAGRLILLFIADGARLGGADPLDAPFFRNPQPVASRELPSLADGETIEFDARSLSWPTALENLDGGFRVRAVYRQFGHGTGHDAPGNFVSEATHVDLAPDRDDTVDLTLDGRIPEKALPSVPNVAWVELRSELLSDFAGHDVMHRAGVVFPRDYARLDAPRRMWPTIYVIPGFGGTERDALGWARMMATPGTEAVAPQAVYVILDPESEFGHHGFADSDNNGPRAEALVRELIPYLEERFRLIREPNARIVTGHSSGGWSSLWLQLTHPETFGACFASSPDPVDFSAFQASDLYTDANLFVTDEGRERPSFRAPLGPNEDRVMMTTREELGVEHVLGPKGDSGEQWGAWAAAFSSRDPDTGMPRPLINPETGAIDRATVEHDWSRYDIARLVARNWDVMGPILRDRVRIVVGDRDSFYLERAVERLRDLVASRLAEDPSAGAARGYIEIVPRATHSSVVPLTTLRWNGEMVEHLRRFGYHD